jgi:hypothetical protein
MLSATMRSFCCVLDRTSTPCHAHAAKGAPIFEKSKRKIADRRGFAIDPPPNP